MELRKVDNNAKTFNAESTRTAFLRALVLFIVKWFPPYFVKIKNGEFEILYKTRYVPGNTTTSAWGRSLRHFRFQAFLPGVV